MSTKKKPSVDRARPKLRVTGKSDVAKVTATKALATAMPQSADWPQATEVQAALQFLSQHSAAMEANAKVVSDLRMQLNTAVQKAPALRSDWEVAAGKLLYTVEAYCNGAAEKVTAFGLDVQQRVQHGLQPAPAGLTVNTGKAPGQVVAKWTKGTALHGFVVQHATDTANPATYSAIEPSTKTHITLGGLPSGTVVHVRIAAVDPKASPALSPWSDWASAPAR